MLDWLKAHAEGRPEEALVAVRKLYELALSGEIRYAVGRDALVVNRPGETLRMYPDEFMEEIYEFGASRGSCSPVYLTRAHHLLGDHERELVAAERALRHYPRRPTPMGGTRPGPLLPSGDRTTSARWQRGFCPSPGEMTSGARRGTCCWRRPRRPARTGKPSWRWSLPSGR